MFLRAEMVANLGLSPRGGKVAKEDWLLVRDFCNSVQALWASCGS